MYTTASPSEAGSRGHRGPDRVKATGAGLIPIMRTSRAAVRSLWTMSTGIFQTFVLDIQLGEFHVRRQGKRSTKMKMRWSPPSEILHRLLEEEIQADKRRAVRGGKGSNPGRRVSTLEAPPALKRHAGKEVLGLC